MKPIQEAITRTIARTVLKTKKNSPHILFIGGLVGIVTSTVLACRSTLQLEKVLDEVKIDLQSVKAINSKSTEIEGYSEKDHYKDLTYVYSKSAAKLAKLYGPSVILGGASIVALTGSHIQLTRRNGALTVTLSALSKAYDEYRGRVREEIGETRELELYRGIRDEKINVDGKNEIVKVADPNKWSQYARIFDETSINWQKDAELNRIFIQCQQNYANHLLRARGHVFLNEVYDSLGFERSRAGAVVGWVLDGEGDGYVDFGMFDAYSSRFVNNLERSIILDFNVDGVIYDKI